MSWQDLVSILTTHAIGRKEGTCIVPAVFRGDRRHKADADQIDAAFLDSDGGATLDEIAAALLSMGCDSPHIQHAFAPHDHHESKSRELAEILHRLSNRC